MGWDASHATQEFSGGGGRGSFTDWVKVYNCIIALLATELPN